MGTKIDYKELANTLINSSIELNGIFETLRELLYDGLTKEQLIELKFDRVDIEYAIEEYEKEMRE